MHVSEVAGRVHPLMANLTIRTIYGGDHNCK